MGTLKKIFTNYYALIVYLWLCVIGLILLPILFLNHDTDIAYLKNESNMLDIINAIILIIPTLIYTIYLIRTKKNLTINKSIG